MRPKEKWLVMLVNPPKTIVDRTGCFVSKRWPGGSRCAHGGLTCSFNCHVRVCVLVLSVIQTLKPSLRRRQQPGCLPKHLSAVQSLNASSRGRSLCGKLFEEVRVSVKLLLDNVQSANQFAISIQLGESRPFRIFLQSLTNIVVGQNIEETCQSVSRPQRMYTRSTYRI